MADWAVIVGLFAADDCGRAGVDMLACLDEVAEACLFSLKRATGWAGDCRTAGRLGDLSWWSLGEGEGRKFRRFDASSTAASWTCPSSWSGEDCSGTVDGDLYGTVSQSMATGAAACRWACFPEARRGG